MTFLEWTEQIKNIILELINYFIMITENLMNNYIIKFMIYSIIVMFIIKSILKVINTISKGKNKNDEDIS